MNEPRGHISVLRRVPARAARRRRCRPGPRGRPSAPGPRAPSRPCRVRSRVAQASLGQLALEAEVEGGPHRGVDAHVGHHARDDQLRDPEPAQVRLAAASPGSCWGSASGTRVSSGSGAAPGWISAPGVPGRKNVAPGRAARCWMWTMGRPARRKACSRIPGLEPGLGAAHQLHGAAGEVVVLEVDEQQGLGHGMPLRRELNGIRVQEPTGPLRTGESRPSRSRARRVAMNQKAKARRSVIPPTVNARLRPCHRPFQAPRSWVASRFTLPP